MPHRYSSDPSERARQLHAEGRFGGAEFGRLGGRPRRLPPSIAVVEAVERLDADKIVAALEDGLGEHQSIQTRLRAVKLALEVEASVGDVPSEREREPSAYEQMSREELVESITALVRA